MSSHNLLVSRSQPITMLPGDLWQSRPGRIARLLRRKSQPPWRVTNPGVFPAGRYRVTLDPDSRTATIRPADD